VRLKGLELIGLSPSTPAVAIELPAAPAADADESEPHIPADSTLNPQPSTCLDIQGEDLTMSAGLPLFELA